MNSSKEVISQNLREEREVPENNLITKLSKLFYLTGKIVESSRLKKDRYLRPGKRSLLQRRIRRQFLEEVKKTDDKQEQKRIFAEARAREAISNQYLRQSKITVDLGELGVQSSRYVVLEPPEGLRRDELPPVFLIPGISNDIDPVGGLAQELAYSGRKVVVIAYPESTQGTVTSEFSAAVAESKSFNLHAEYYQKAIQHLVKELSIENFELWSHSTGGPISAIALESDDFKQKVENVVFLSPASAVDQSLASLGLGAVKEMVRALKKFPDISKYSLTVPRKEEKDPNKDKVMQSLIAADCRKYKRWKEVSLGKIEESQAANVIFWSGNKDTMTYTGKATDLGIGENQTIISDANGTHLTALINPAKVIASVDAALGRSTT